MKTLIIDNNQVYLESIRSFLGSEYNEIDTVNSPLDALESMKYNKYDIVICDIFMDKMNAIDLIDQIKQLDNNVKVIIHSSSIDINIKKLASIKGAYNYYLRPSYPQIKNDIDILNRGLDNYII